KAIGYGEFFDPSLGIDPAKMDFSKIDKNSDCIRSLKEKIKMDSRRYAKRQYTFMRGIPNALSFDMEDRESIEQEILRFCRSRMESL
ncbi:MAG: hypothetical protein IJJ66_02900, partial [Treponema sp.]|nr:hypothetical protein [Treponema sp.]